MKGKLLIFFLILTFSFSILVSCSDTEEFTHCELTLVLDKSFREEESEEYDLLLSNGEAVVSLTRISFEAGFDSGIPPSLPPSAAIRSPPQKRNSACGSALRSPAISFEP